MPDFAVYLHPEVCATSKPLADIFFRGHSIPYFMQVGSTLAAALPHYPSLPLHLADLDLYLSVHEADYLRAIQRMANDEPLEEVPHLSLECTGYEYCLPGYQASLGGLIKAINLMKHGHIQRAYCYSLGGHHAHANWGHGYCMLNPIAAAARYAQAQGFHRILIVDWDYHHGDGTQTLFAHDPNIYCVSIHNLVDLYMSLNRVMRLATTVAAAEVGHCNIPILPDLFDDDFLRRMNLPGDFYRGRDSIHAFEGTLNQLPWTPDLIFIFSGYDAHHEDQGKGCMNWTNDDFRQLTHLVLETARQANCPVLSVHGGGYNLPITVAAAVAHIDVLATYP